ncbi:hypothetical protein [Nonomuraea sp. NPDC002799]
MSDAWEKAREKAREEVEAELRESWRAYLRQHWTRARRILCPFTMTPSELAVYYDDPVNAEAMCRVLMTAHPGWAVQRLSPHRTFRSVPVWVARRESWPADQESLMNENAGLLNLAMTMVDKVMM